MDALNRITGSSIVESALKQVESPSLIVTLQRRKTALEEQLAQVVAALSALEKHPDVAEVLELVARTRW